MLDHEEEIEALVSQEKSTCFVGNIGVNCDNKEEEDLTMHLNLQIFREHHDLFSHRPCNIEEIQQLDFFFLG